MKYPLLALVTCLFVTAVKTQKLKQQRQQKFGKDGKVVTTSGSFRALKKKSGKGSTTTPDVENCPFETVSGSGIGST